MKHFHFLSRRIDKLFPYIICLGLPWLNIINTSYYLKAPDFTDLLIRWSFTAGLLLGIWFLNAWLINRVRQSTGILLIFGINAGIVSLLALGYHFEVQGQTNLTNDEPTWHVAFKLSIGILILLTTQISFKVIRENEKLKTENFALQTENYRAQLDQLKKQVNPHFLFNSLSTLQTMIRAKDEQSEAFVLKLSDLYRQLLHSRESNAISLEEEVKFLDLYLYLLKARHADALAVDIQTDAPSLKRKLPIFALQLLVENCTKHNVISESRPLKIEIFQKDPDHITVVNNFQPRKQVQSFGLGLENLRKRYALLGVQDGLDVQQDENSFFVTLTLI